MIIFMEYDTQCTMFKICMGVEALVRWLKLAAWEVGHGGLVPNPALGLQRNRSLFSLTRKDSILWRASVTEDSSIYLILTLWWVAFYI